MFPEGTEPSRLPTRSDFVEAARHYLDVKFRHQGRTEQGLDCIGFLFVAARDCGMLEGATGNSEFDFTAYKRRPDSDLLRTKLREYLVAVPKNQARAGDIVFFSDDEWVHVGILTPRFGMGLIHAYVLARKVVEHPYNDEWRARTAQVFAFGGWA